MFFPARLAFGSVFFSLTLAMPQKPTVFASLASRLPFAEPCAYPASGAHGVHEDTRVTASIFKGSTYKSLNTAAAFSGFESFQIGTYAGVGVCTWASSWL